MIYRFYKQILLHYLDLKKINFSFTIIFNYNQFFPNQIYKELHLQMF